MFCFALFLVLLSSPNAMCACACLRFLVHSCCFSCLSCKLQELVPFLGGRGNKDDEDGVAGLMRFLILHFPAVCNKLLPEGRPASFLFCYFYVHCLSLFTFIVLETSQFDVHLIFSSYLALVCVSSSNVKCWHVFSFKSSLRGFSTSSVLIICDRLRHEHHFLY